MELCKPCDDVLRFGYNDKRTIHEIRQSFLAAVEKECYICHGLFYQLPEEWRQEFTDDSPAKKRLKLDDQSQWLTSFHGRFSNTRVGTIELNLQMLGLTDSKSQNPCFQFYPVKATSDTEPTPASLLWTVTSTSTNSEETFAKIQVWLDRCEKTHAKCRYRREQADSKWHPTRLVKILSKPENSDNADNLRCQIVELKPEDVPQDFKYATLSHRWPQDEQEIQKLTADKLLEWKTALPVNILRQTFRDAFLVAQNLGISYVWIDSLCIIQHGDEKVDWEHEAPMMHKVYSNAAFNICASTTDRDDKSAGLFSPREPSTFQSLPRKLFDPEDFKCEDVNDYDCDDSGHYLIRRKSSMGIWDAVMKGSSLASRGWVLQEQLLSRANVYFGGSEVLFECMEMRASESSGLDEDYEGRWEMGRKFLKEHLPIPTAEQGRPVLSDDSSDSDDDRWTYEYEYDEFYKDNYKRWHDLLSRYTALALSQSGDRLVALSGVAHYFRNLPPQDDHYIAGLWRNRLATELLWQMTKDTQREKWCEQKTRRNNLTFSWLSVEGQVENKADPHRPVLRVTPLADVKVIKCRTSTETLDPTVDKEQLFKEDIFSLPPTENIVIRMTGFLRPMRLDRVGLIQRGWMWPAVKNRTDRGLDLLLSLGGHSGLAPGKWSKTGKTMLDFDIESTELDELNSSGRLFLMPLAKVAEYSLWLLLLELVATNDGVKMGRFRRIGVHKVSIYANGEEDDWLFSSDSILEREAIDVSYASSLGIYEGVSELPPWRYNGDLGRPKQHTIFIV